MTREEPQPDRLPEIKRLLTRRSDGEWSGTFTTSGCDDVAWLVAEVERQADEIAEIQKYAAGLEQALQNATAELGLIDGDDDFQTTRGF